MRYAVVNEDKVTSFQVSDPQFAKTQGWVEAPDNVDVGWSYSNGIFKAPAAPPTPTEVFNPISDRQLFQGLASDPYNVITTQEALGAVKTGEIPAVMQAVIDQMPPEAQFAASMIISGGTQFERFNPMVETFAASRNWPVAQTNQFWHFCESL